MKKNTFFFFIITEYKNIALKFNPNMIEYEGM